MDRIDEKVPNMSMCTWRHEPLASGEWWHTVVMQHSLQLCERKHQAGARNYGDMGEIRAAKIIRILNKHLNKNRCEGSPELY